MVKPVIAITGPQKGAAGPRLMVALAVRLYGGQPLQLRPGDTLAEYDYQGVVVTGGHDIDPVLYASEPEVEPRYDKLRDHFESAVIDDALRRRLPLLGICRGAQLLNVRRNGSLYQDIKSQRRITSNRRTFLPLKTLEVEPGSLLADCLGQSRCKINSLHNQAIERTGYHLHVSGRDLDGIIQAIEDPGYGFLIGVQWHPEFLIFMKRQRQLFAALVESARLHA
ncbi:gamma-glutamyl-gamma-aminobutyrate hydrolase family protein [Nitrincola alkalilacustris]|uniref:gamma-glutamyl-gamma-aminobutyrate hydrolase family protein n=1 Tax=Nitrincola alkalilacustris TaxID=1571224 RepID=UPI00124DC2A2|nr:gamma-glutamyl-gamma-aminobutyrate hydrolase family protein [Nitrincola alkalilacustris]